MPVDVAKYAQELMEASGITDAEQKKALEAFLGNDKVKQRLTNTLSDIEAEKGRTAAVEKKRQEEYQENLRIFNGNKKAVDEANARVQAYVNTYGELPGGGDPADPQARRAAVADVIDKKTYDEDVKRRDGLTVGLVKAASKITALHLKNFNEVPDFDAIEKIAMEQGLNAEKAYEEWIKPKVAEKTSTEWDAKLKAAREEGFRDGVSKRAAGQVEDATPPSAFLEHMRKKPDATAPSARAAFDEGWSAWKPPVKSV